MDSTFLNARIAAVQLQIVAIENAILAVGTGGAQSYMLDTGQSRQTVTKLNIVEMQRTLNSLYNMLATLESRLNGSVTIGVPGW